MQEEASSITGSGELEVTLAATPSVAGEPLKRGAIVGRAPSVAALVASILCLAPFGLLDATAHAADEYPICDRTVSLPWPDSCIIGSYRHYSDIFSSHTVHRAGPVSDFSYGNRIDGVSYELDGTTQSLADYFDAARATGLVVLKDGKIVFERYMLGADEHTLFNSQSMAKSLVSTMVGFVIADGLVRSIDDPISDYVPELKGSGYEGVPIKAILQMSSGVEWDDESASSGLLHMMNETMRLHSKSTTDFVRETKPWLKPFEKFNYAAVDANALGWMVSRVTGRSLSDYLSEKLWEPMGMEADATWVTDGDGPAAHEIANGGFNAVLRDYARFGLLMAQNGSWHGKQLLPPNWVREATWPDRPQVAHGALWFGYPNGYQYQWWSFPGADHEFTAWGSRGQYIFVNSPQRVVIAATSAWPVPYSERLERQTWAVFHAFVEALRD